MAAPGSSSSVLPQPIAVVSRRLVSTTSPGPALVSNRNPSLVTTVIPPQAPDPIPRGQLTNTANGQAATSSSSDSSDDDDDDDGDEPPLYEVEKIVSHHESDPRTHPAKFGRKPIMLYQVKWKGYEALTWEPIDSFDNDELVNKYWAKRVKDSESTV